MFLTYRCLSTVARPTALSAVGISNLVPNEYIHLIELKTEFNRIGNTYCKLIDALPLLNLRVNGSVDSCFVVFSILTDQVSH
jgi:hypothetical protein